MTAQITIIGLGQIGASVGMALKDKPTVLHRVGYDKDTGVARAAESLGVVDQIKSLPGAVKDAEIVMLCLPLSQIRETLELIGPHLKENAVLIDTAPVKNLVAEWTKELVPAGRFSLGLVPALTPEALSESETGLKAARPDLFKQTVMVVDVPSDSPAGLEQLAFDLVGMLGAKPMLADVAESDGLMTTAHLLPQLTSAALLDATVDQAGWAEARKLAGRPYLNVTGGIAYYDDPASLKDAALANRFVVLHALDMLIASLKGLRDEVDHGDEESLHERLEQAYLARERWLGERSTAEWMGEGGEPVDVPDFNERFGQIFLGGAMIGRDRKKK